MARIVSRKYLLPFILITSLFFIWGFARAILDVLNKHFQELMHISIGQSALIQATTYLGYFLMALPAGVIISKVGYRKGVVTGLLLFAAGAFLFIPSEMTMSFGMFLAALFIIGCGLVMLETSANPYAAELGDKESAASRLNFAQAFNGLGCILAPVIVGGFLFSSADSKVSVPYTIMGIAVLFVALLFSKVKLPEITPTADASAKEEQDSLWLTIRNLLSRRKFIIGLIALLFYEVAEVSINSLFINYATAEGWMDKATAAEVLSFGALTLFMLARIAGSGVMSKISAVKVLMTCAILAMLGALMVTLNLGLLSKIGLFACYAFEAIMFPTIFAITITGVSSKSIKIASSLLMMTPIGGAVGTLLMSLMADNFSIPTAFLVPACGYAAVLLYSLSISAKELSIAQPRKRLPKH